MKTRKESRIVPIIFGGFMVLSYIVMRFIYKGKYDFLHIISERINFPSMWIFNFLYMITLFFLGVSLGLLASELTQGGVSLQNENAFLRGGILFSIIYFLSLSWYPSLFVLELPLLSFVIILLCVLLTVFLIYAWSRVSISHTLLVFPFLLWTLYLLVLNFIIIFRI